MNILEPPWSGLAVIAPRVDLWPILHAARVVDAPTLRPGGAQLCLGLASRRAPELLDEAALTRAGLSAAHARTVVQTPGWAARPGVSFLRVGAPGWPRQMTELPFGAVALSAEGNLALLERPAVAVVGARACTPYGKSWAGRIAAAVAAAGGVVVSGLAAGIDCAAHASAPGATIAVLGQGLDASMPAWQARVRDTLLERGGLLLSELPPAARATPFTFPIRNRIIAGLAGVVAVIEAGARSGARNTASHGLRLGREVLALPGPLGAPASEGCLDLIEQGATVIRGVETVVEVARLHRHPPAGPAGPPDVVLAALEHVATPDDLARHLAWPRTAVMAALGMLELTGRATRLPGGRYQARP